LGAQDVNRLPEYIKASDVCINPQLLNETTKGNYPRKIDEYLAMGKPVVATKTIAMDILKIGFIWQRRRLFKANRKAITENSTFNGF
jgi:glycosyltransferase involved in cell wall biosynthesis